jgi:deoxyribodipyrimidine photo-lyase
VPVFCFDDRLLGRHGSGPRTQFLLECLADLDRSLRARGSRLVVRHGRPEIEIPKLASQTNADAVHFTTDVSAFARERDARTTAALKRTGVHRARAPGPVRRRRPRRHPHAKPRSLHGLHPGEYDESRNLLAEPGTSRLSPHLHFGCLSPRELEERVTDEAYRRQLCWRDFYAHVLLHFPHNAHREHQARYRGTIRWSRAGKRFEAWCQGGTGYPLVDAGMRQLRREGWMHNRARLVVGSFLTKDLGIDWRWGERHFMRLLLDGDEASNNGNWQWIASVGVDPQPAFRRIFNPARQRSRFDPDQKYIRRYVPELSDGDGTDSPDPIVDHATARREALERYRV